jgi:hypothetical protein
MDAEFDTGIDVEKVGAVMLAAPLSAALGLQGSPSSWAA